MNPAAFDLIDGIPHYKLYIGGKWQNSSHNRLADDVNPATGKVFARTQQASAKEVNRAIEAADCAARSWGKTLVSEREVLLRGVVTVSRALCRCREEHIAAPTLLLSVARTPQRRRQRCRVRLH